MLIFYFCLFIIIGALSQRLKDKEKFLVEAGELLTEAQKHYESQRNKAEQIGREKALITGTYFYLCIDISVMIFI